VHLIFGWYPRLLQRRYESIASWPTATVHGLASFTSRRKWLAPEFQWPAGIEDLSLMMAEQGGTR